MARQPLIDSAVAKHTPDPGLFLFLGLTLIVVVYVNTSLAYVSPSSTVLSFLTLSRRAFWLTVFLSVAVSFMHGSRVAMLVGAAVCAMFLLRILSAISPGASFLLIAYQMSHSLIVAVAAASLFTKASWLYEGGVRFVVFLSVPILLVQMLGVSEAVHFLHTAAMGFDRVVDIELSPTLRVGFEELTTTYQQIRPPGLFYANSIAAIFVVFAIALRLSEPLGRVTVYDLFLFYTPFLLMAKMAIVFLVLALAVRLAVASCKDEALSVSRLALVAIGLFLLHWLIFPGVVADRLSLRSLYVSTGIRLVDFLMSVGVDAIPFSGVRLLDFGEQQFLLEYGDQLVGSYSGMRLLILLAPLLILMSLWIKRVGKKFYVSVKDKRRSGFLILALVFVLMTQAVLGTPMIPFLFGPALVPLLSERTAGQSRLVSRIHPPTRDAAK